MQYYIMFHQCFWRGKIFPHLLLFLCYIFKIHITLVHHSFAQEAHGLLLVQLMVYWLTLLSCHLISTILPHKVTWFLLDTDLPDWNSSSIMQSNLQTPAYKILALMEAQRKCVSQAVDGSRGLNSSLTLGLPTFSKSICNCVPGFSN